ncbi:adenylate kinase [Canibacter sp. lx-72]|uniref:adenylate kinase n=1 Tax=Canibacter zhuwentaonis TaxID=2837491 RepID=UPI001BDC5949|nr:adenylate kinase [Canibacter zhuwentaonis]MBT1018163.1 adenylate kinase [Canibacter zhuwentaonis]
MTDNLTKLNLLIIGAPGAGKGTQAQLIAEKYQIPTISTGDIFRENIKTGTELGQKVQQIIAAGELVPDSLTNEIVADRLQQDDVVNGFLLDGYPRNEAQVVALDQFLADRGEVLTAVIMLEADTDVVVSRLLQRAFREGRDDDTEEVIRHRQNVYREQTAPLVAIFSERGILVSVDGLGSVAEIAERINTALAVKLGS